MDGTNIPKPIRTPEELAQAVGGSATPLEGGKYVVHSGKPVDPSGKNTDGQSVTNWYSSEEAYRNNQPFRTSINGLVQVEPTFNINNGRLQVSAPQSFFDSTYYKEQVKPMLDSYVGTNVVNQQEMAKLNADIQEQFNAAVNRYQINRQMTATYGQMSDEQADNIINTNSAASLVSSGNVDALKDMNVPVVLGTEDLDSSGGLFGIGGSTRGTWTSGNDMTQEMSVQEFLDRFNSWNDSSKSIYLDTLANTADNTTSNPYLRARSEALLNLIYAANNSDTQYKGIANADFGTKVYNAFSKAADNIANSGVGRTLQTIGGQDKTRLNTMYGNLGGAANYEWIGNTIGSGIGLAADMWAAGRLAAAANSLTGVNAAVRAASAADDAAKGLQQLQNFSRVRNGVATLFGGGIGGGKIARAWRVLDPVGSVAYGTWQASVQPRDENNDGYGANDFVNDLIGNAVFYGGIRGLSAGAKVIGNTTPGRAFNRGVNRAIAKASGTKLGKRLSTITSTPEEAASRRKARLADDQANRDWIKRRNAARANGETFNEPYPGSINYVTNENNLSRKRNKRANDRYYSDAAMKNDAKYRRRAGMSPNQSQADASDASDIISERTTEQVATAPTGQVDEAADNAINSVQDYLDQATPERTPEENELKSQSPDVDDNKAKSKDTDTEVDNIASDQQVAVDTADKVMDQNPDAFGRKETTTVVDPDTGETATVQSRMPKNVADWNNDTTKLNRLTVTQKLDDITKKIRKGESLTPDEQTLLDQWRSAQISNRERGAALPEPLSAKDRYNLDRAINFLQTRLASNPLTKDPRALALARQQRAALQKISSSIERARARLNLRGANGFVMTEPFLNALERNPEFQDYMTLEPTFTHTTQSTARGGTQTVKRTHDYMGFAKRDYLDPITTMTNKYNGLKNAAYMESQRRVQQAMVNGAGGAAVTQSSQAIARMDDVLDTASTNIRQTIADNPGLGLDDLDSMFNYTRVENVDELSARSGVSRQEISDVNRVRNSIAGSKLSEDMDVSLSPDSPASKLRQTNPEAFVKDSYSIDDVDEAQAKRTAQEYQDAQAAAANTPGLFALNASRMNIVNMSNETGAQFMNDTFGSIPDSIINRLPADQQELVNGIKFGRAGYNMSDALEIPLVRNYLEQQGIHAIRTADGGFIQVSPNARIYNTSITEYVVLDRLNRTSSSKKDMNKAVGDCAAMLAANIKYRMFQSDSVYNTILRQAEINGISPDAVAMSMISRDNRMIDNIANKLYENSNNGGIAQQKQVQALVAQDNPDLVPNGWQPGDKVLTRQDFIAQSRRNADGTLNKNDVKKYDKRWKKFDSECKDPAYQKAANATGDFWTKQDFRKYVKDFLRQQADNAVRMDSLSPRQRKTIKDTSSASAEIEATNGKSKRDIKRSKNKENAARTNMTATEREAQSQAVDNASSDTINDSTMSASSNNPDSMNKTKWSDDNVSDVTTPSTSGGENSTLTGDSFVADAVKEESGGSKSNGPVKSFMQTITNIFVRMPNQAMRIGNTTIPMTSWIRNWARDGVASFVTTGSSIIDTLGLDPFNPVGYLINSPDFYSRILQKFNGDDNAAKEYLVNALVDLKGPIGGINESSLYWGNEESNGNSIRKACNKVMNLLETPNNFFDETTRLTVGITTLDNYIRMGYSPEYAKEMALFNSRTATTDFSMGMGQLEKFRRNIPYFTSAVNGTRSFYKMWSVDPAGVTLRLVCGVLTPIVYCTMSNLTDPEKKKRYEQISEEDKEANLIFIGKDGSAMYIPLPQEMYAYANTARKLVEKMNGDIPDTMWQIAADGALDLSPFDIGWVSDVVRGTDDFGNPIDMWDAIGTGVARTAESISPVTTSILYSWATGKSMYFGDEISGYSDMNSPTYNAIADFLHLPTGNSADKEQSIAQVKNTLSELFGTTGQWVINAIDRAAGASEQEAGGKSFRDSVAKTLTGETSYDAATTKFYELVDSLENQKEDLKNSLSDMDKKIREAESDSDKQSLQEERQKLIDEYVQKVGNSVDKYSQMFEITGGITQKRKNQLIALLNLGTDEATGRGEYGSYYADEASDADRQEYYDALQRYEDLGIEDPTPPILPYRDANGEWQLTDKSIAIQNAINRQYGAPKQMQYDVEQAINREDGNGRNLWDIRNEFKDQIDAIYDEADAKGTKPDYDKIAELQYQFLDYFDQAMEPVINQYSEFVFTNNDVVDDLRSLLNNMIPTETYQKDKSGRFRSMPMMDVDLWKWLQNHYGIGYGNTSGMPSDDEVNSAVNRINDALSKGQMAQAKALAQRINRRIGNGNLYANSNDMNTISSVLGY